MTYERPLGSTYVLGPRLGRGSTGQVFRARRSDGGDGEFAVKLLHNGSSEDDETLGRFLREKKILTSLDHPDIVKVVELVVDGGEVGIVMDLVGGGDLRRLLKSGPLPAVQVVRLGGQVAGALDAAHSAGVVHGDVKPENILIAAADPVAAKLSDFGVARFADATASKSSSRVGTPTYMAPEFITDDPVGPPADVYSLGVLLYEALLGRPPFTGSSPVELWRAHTHSDPTRPDELSDAWWGLLRSMLAKSAEDRPTAREVADALPAGHIEPELAAAGAPDDAPQAAGESTLLPGDGPADDAESRLPTVLKQRITEAPVLAATARPKRTWPARRAAVAAAVVLAVAGSVAWGTGLVPSRSGDARNLASPRGESAGQVADVQPTASASTSLPSTAAPSPSASPTAEPTTPAATPPVTDSLPAPQHRGQPGDGPTSTPISPDTVVVAKPKVPAPPGVPRPPAPATAAQCQAASNSGGLDIGSELNNSGGPNYVPSPCTSIWLTLTQVEYITYAKACLEDGNGTDTRCGGWVYLKDNGAWNRLLDGVAPGNRWQLYLKAEGEGHVGFRFSG